ncbi:phosphatidylinositide phosphatase SAC2 [Caerostris extrusa]|uniref:Phosphatidylinositide phosphatase SAC2 n=1 Tax=Caerostris extrusa TaxID=172846 RepID=A0AAV4X8Q9_CAEEX|nr:phosphatidylinositide phosphatase SAC2 [Caerostris extrusa]
MLPLNQQLLPDVEFEVCKKHRFNPKKADKLSNNPDVQQKAFQKTWNSLKAATSQVKSRKQPKEQRDREKLEKKSN